MRFQSHNPEARPAVVLAGPPGVGKSTICSAAAARLGVPAWDLDALVTERTGHSPADLIRNDGELAFRRIEAETLGAFADPGILALGGGTLTTPDGRRAARRHGPILGLELPIPALATRLAGEDQTVDRPLNAEGIEALVERRARSYRAVDKRVDAQGSVEDVVERVVEEASRCLRLDAEVGAQHSRIVVGEGLHEAAAGALAHLEPTRPVIAIVDLGIPAEERARFLAPIQSLLPTHVIEVEGGESVKAWSRAGQVLEDALAHGGGRQSAVVGLGGGATCDLAGLVAHLLGRGAPLVLVPSTLLSQVDASVGGKCAVNMDAGRNLVGAFHAAHDVIADVGLLKSLSEAEYRSGLAELVKMAIIGDADLFDEIVEQGPTAVTATQIARAIQLKADIVRRDPFEKDERRHLNLGHTLGHGLETASGHELRHGEAVAIGTAAMARWSAERGWCSTDDAQRIVRGLQRLELPTFADATLLRAAAGHIGTDKKSTTTHVALVRIHTVASVSVQALPLNEAREGLVRHGGQP